MDQVKEAAWKGYLQPGDALPSIRKLAMNLQVTPNTVAKAYQMLEKERVIVTMRGKGVFLSEKKSYGIDPGKLEDIKENIRGQLLELIYLEFDEDKILALIDKIYKELEGEEK
nr:GntR family transcriptional regulator [Anaerostipes sp. MSJ-23]